LSALFPIARPSLNPEKSGHPVKVNLELRKEQREKMGQGKATASYGFRGLHGWENGGEPSLAKLAKHAKGIVIFHSKSE
jgi:hypothetical protein